MGGYRIRRPLILYLSKGIGSRFSKISQRCRILVVLSNSMGYLWDIPVADKIILEISYKY